MLGFGANRHMRICPWFPRRPTPCRGSLANFIPYRRVTFELTRNGEEVKANYVSVNSRNGDYVIYDLVPGAYRVRALQGENQHRMMAEREVQVTNSNLTGVGTQLAPGISLSGSMHREKSAEAATENDDVRGILGRRHWNGMIVLHAVNGKDADATVMVEDSGQRCPGFERFRADVKEECFEIWQRAAMLRMLRGFPSRVLCLIYHQISGFEA